MGWRRSRLVQEKGDEKEGSRVAARDLAAAEKCVAEAPVAEPSLLRDRRLARPANAEPRAALLRAGQQALGNATIRRMATPAGRGPLQAKLTVNPPGDIYEQEADRVAETVLRMPAPRVQRQELPEEELAQAKPLDGAGAALLQRQELPEEEEEELAQAKPLDGAGAALLQRQELPEEEELAQAKLLDGVGAVPLQRQEEEEEEEPVQPKALQRQEEEEEEPVQAKMLGEAIQAAAAGGVPRVTADLEERIGRLRGGGQPLAESERAFFEPRLGHDLSGVRLHTGGEAAGTAQALQAKAFTVGSDIVFGTGQYAPETTAGRGLLAHELTHVVQQSGGRLAPVPLDDEGQQRQEAGPNADRSGSLA